MEDGRLALGRSPPGHFASLRSAFEFRGAQGVSGLGFRGLGVSGLGFTVLGVRGLGLRVRIPSERFRLQGLLGGFWGASSALERP